MQDLLHFLTAGSVDDGKSTFIGRLLYDSGMIYDDHIKSLKKDSKQKSSVKSDIDLSFVVDGLKEERLQGITIDVAYRYFTTKKRKFIIADTPGHEQYTRNMVTGASRASLVVLLIDAQKGVTIQTKRHAFIASLLGIDHAAVVINKMDLVDHSEKVFNKIVSDYKDFSSRLTTRDVHFFPVSALYGDNVVKKSENTPWYKGEAFLPFLENIYIASDKNHIDLRFPVQNIIRAEKGFRGYAGTLCSGVLRKGEDVTILPSKRTSKIKSIVTYNGELEKAGPDEAICVTLEDDIDVGRGDMIVSSRNQPTVLNELGAMLVWMDSEISLNKGYQFLLKQTTRTVQGTLKEIQYRTDVHTLRRTSADSLNMNDIGRVKIELHQPVFTDTFDRNHSTGSFILIDKITNRTVAAGMVLARDAAPEKQTVKKKNEHISTHKSLVPRSLRQELLSQKGAVVWLTGLPCSGKTTIAYELEKKLVQSGHLAYVLDGDNLRNNLNSDLGFSPEDRSKNIERVANVAKIISDTGAIAIVSLISPYIKDRESAKNIADDTPFFEIYLSTPLETCEARDIKGHYKKARRGQITNFTGINAPYEAPLGPSCELDTSKMEVKEAVEKIFSMLEPLFIKER